MDIHVCNANKPVQHTLQKTNNDDSILTAVYPVVYFDFYHPILPAIYLLSIRVTYITVLLILLPKL